jgi:predicted nucleic acid-binding protein
MVRYFFDSSAIVKRYHQEAGSPWVHSVCDPRTRLPLYLAELARVEVVVGLRRTGRREGLHPSFVDTMVNQFERHLTLSDPTRPNPMYRLIPLSPVVLALAARLGNRYWESTPHPLRSLDAIQLAAGLSIARALPDEFIFVTADVRLAAIAPMEGFRVINPEYPPQP